MKIAALALSLVLLAGCAQSKVIGGARYKPYGLIDRDQVRNPDVEYAVVMGNVLWGIVLCETIAAPVYFFGFALYEPKCKRPHDAPIGWTCP